MRGKPFSLRFVALKKKSHFHRTELPDYSMPSERIWRRFILSFYRDPSAAAIDAARLLSSFHRRLGLSKHLDASSKTCKRQLRSDGLPKVNGPDLEGRRLRGPRLERHTASKLSVPSRNPIPLAQRLHIFFLIFFYNHCRRTARSRSSLAGVRLCRCRNPFQPAQHVCQYAANSALPPAGPVLLVMCRDAKSCSKTVPILICRIPMFSLRDLAYVTSGA
ncbi:hypothetical protein IWX90DRAFT_139733 [Phyllosticta citrichinensis]|uniref:Uncharacterized protein n=1 Tax=Phyllosticta citrichinensis TaxID=1130410 RepID=A0ABR1XZ50_9PEZI